MSIAVKPSFRGLLSFLALAGFASAQMPEIVHPGFTLVNLRPSTFQPKGITGMDWLPDGNMIVSTWGGYNRTEGEVLILSGVQSQPPALTIRKIAGGLREPMGLKVVNGEVFLMQRHEFSKLALPASPTGMATPARVAGGWQDPAGDWTYGLEFHNGAWQGLQGGWDAGGIKPDQGHWFKINGTSYQKQAGGLRSPNGLGLGPDNQLFATDNQGNWLPASKLIHLVPGRNYGCKNNTQSPYFGQPETPPAIWLPHMEIGASPSHPLLVQSGLYQGQMLVGDVRFGGIQRFFVEKIGGEYQGAVFRFSGGFECGVNRLLWGPDGSLYVAGVGGSPALGDLGGWNHLGKWYGLQKLVPNGKTVFDMLAVRSVNDGFEIEFTKPVGAAASNPATFTVSHGKYVPTASYGGQQQEKAPLTVSKATLLGDGRKVHLKVDGLRTGFVVTFKVNNLKAADGEALWADKAWYTLNRMGPPVGIARPAATALRAPAEGSSWHDLKGRRIEDIRKAHPGLFPRSRALP